MEYPFNQMRWEYRQKKIASRIPEGSSVLDVGGGKQVLKEFLKNPSEYISIDCQDVAEGTIVADLNKDGFPYEELKGKVFDVAVLQGVLEYIDDIEHLLKMVGLSARNMIVTYYEREEKLPLWTNNHKFEYVEEKIRNAGWGFDQVVALKENNQRIYFCHRDFSL